MIEVVEYDKATDRNRNDCVFLINRVIWLLSMSYKKYARL